MCSRISPPHRRFFPIRNAKRSRIGAHPDYSEKKWIFCVAERTVDANRFVGFAREKSPSRQATFRIGNRSANSSHLQILKYADTNRHVSPNEQGAAVVDVQKESGDPGGNVVFVSQDFWAYKFDCHESSFPTVVK